MSSGERVTRGDGGKEEEDYRRCGGNKPRGQQRIRDDVGVEVISSYREARQADVIPYDDLESEQVLLLAY